LLDKRFIEIKGKSWLSQLKCLIGTFQNCEMALRLG